MIAGTWTGKGSSWGKSTEVVATPVKHCSPSQIKTWRDCKRKWTFKYIARKPDKSTPYAKLGSYIHKQLERYLQNGWMQRGPGLAIELEMPNGKTKQWSHDDIVAIMLPGIIHLPSPGVARTERRFEIDLGELGKMIGIKDFAYFESLPIVGDHKTSSNFSYALEPETLIVDPQGVIYAKHEMIETRAPEILGRWIYYATSGRPKAKCVEAKFLLDQNEELWHGVLDDAREMHQLKKQLAPPNEVPCNLEACEKYGGCPFKPFCDRSIGERVRGLFAMVNLRDRMKASNQAAQPVAAQPVAAQPVPEPVSATPAVGINPPEGQSALARLKAKKAEAAAQALAPVPAQPVPAQPVPAPAQAVQEPATVVPATATPAPIPAKQVHRTFDLYIDCAPNTPYQEFSEIAGPVLDELKAEYGHHYKLIPDLYGGNSALFAEALAMSLDSAPVAGAVVVTLASPMVRDVLEVLQARACTIVRGF